MTTSHSKQQKQWGITLPSNEDYPTDYELKLTEDLVKTLHNYGLFESEKEANNR